VPGRPDFIFRRKRLAVFVDGCFWHACRWHCRMPAENRPYWKKRITRNALRDRATNKLLRRTEWRLDKAQQNGAFLRKWTLMLVGWEPGSIPCKPRLPCAGWMSTEAKKDQGGPRRVTATPRPP
jgi:hypothetical protein